MVETGARQSSLRERNLAALVAAVCRADAPPSRADLAVTLAMTRATAGRLVDELVAAKVLDEVDRSPGGRGRPARGLRPGAGIVGLGLAVETDRLLVRAVDLRGGVVTERVEEGPTGPPEVALQSLATLVRHVRASLRGRRVVGIGVAVPGIVTEHGHLLRAPNLGWTDVDVAGALAAVAGRRPVQVANEADMSAVVEAEPAPGRPGPWSDFVHVTAAVGVGGAIVSGGRLVTGEHGGAGELGHVCVDPAGPACACGSTGCLERYVGWEALGPLSADRRDDQVVHALSVALASVVNVVGISSVVLGGHLAALAPDTLAELRERLDARVLGSRWDPVRVRVASGDHGASATGAAHRALADVLERPAAWV